MEEKKEGTKTNKPRIIVTIWHGLVDKVTTEEGAEVLIVDSDIEGADGDEISVIAGEEVCCHVQDSLVNKELIEKAFQDYYDSF